MSAHGSFKLLYREEGSMSLLAMNPRAMRVVGAIVVLLAIATCASTVQALPVIVPNFAVDPSGLAFTIQPVPDTDFNSFNISEPPVLAFGQVSVPDGTTDTLSMNWDPTIPDQPAQAGWELVFGADPDLRFGTISLSVNAPGGIGVGGFSGIQSISVIAVDMFNVIAGGWGFNTDQAGFFPPSNDPLAAGLTSIENNVMHNVTISIGNGPTAGSATIVPIGGSYGGGPFSGPNFLIAGNNNFAQIIKLQYFENGILRGGVSAIPGQSTTGLINYWDHLSITVPPVPEPSTYLMGVIGLLMLAIYRLRLRR